MNTPWADNTPIWLQVRDALIGRILDGFLKPGDDMPSIRQCAVELHINPLTVAKAYQDLAQDGVVMARRGLSPVVNPDARERLVMKEKQRFLTQEWPALVKRLKRLDIDITTLPQDSEETSS